MFFIIGFFWIGKMCDRKNGSCWTSSPSSSPYHELLRGCRRNDYSRIHREPRIKSKIPCASTFIVAYSGPCTILVISLEIYTIIIVSRDVEYNIWRNVRNIDRCYRLVRSTLVQYTKRPARHIRLLDTPVSVVNEIAIRPRLIRTGRHPICATHCRIINDEN